MQYQGGKHRLAKKIAEVIRDVGQGRCYVEPFVGGGSVMAAMYGWPQERYGSDANRALICMWQALQRGWQPPRKVSRATWTCYEARQSVRDPMTAFLGAGCSYMGMWFSSPAPQLAPRARRVLLDQIEKLRDVHFEWARYDELGIGRTDVVYCDPPYADTTGYAATGSSFDHEAFWNQVLRWADRGAIVLVSEYSAPRWIGRPYRTWEVRGGMARAPRTENLYLVK